MVALVHLHLILCTAAAGKIIYVDDDVTSENNGSSWENAYVYLQDALADANSAEKPVEIRVAQGVYTPDRGAGITRGDPFVTFQLINGVTVLGGFAGVGAIEPDARYIEEYKAILSGDLAGDDADVEDPNELSGHPTRAENSYSVVNVWDTDETAVLDGVTITACVTCIFWHGSPSVNNCTFTNSDSGIDGLSRGLRLTNCTFKSLWGNAIHCHGDTLTLTDCLFVGNRMGIFGVFPDDLTLRDCTFIGDGIMESRGAIDFWGDNLKLYNCKFRNIVAGSVVGLVLSDGEFIAENCAFVGNVGRSIDKWHGRMVISNCLFAGNRGGAIHTIDANATIEGCTFSDNSTDQGRSAIDALHGAKVSNCIFWGNSSPAIENLRKEIVVNYSNIKGGWPGAGNINVDPCFVSPGYWDMNNTLEDTTDDFWVVGDYHLKSQAGRWDPVSESWVIDDVTSPCIDAGDPLTPVMYEPHPRGCFINMGAYGGTSEASMSPGM